MYADGNSLYLRVAATGSKQWIWRGTVKGRRCDIGLGGVALVTLAEARAEAVRLRRLARQGVDVLAERRKARAGAVTFEQAARVVFEANLPTWKSEKHAAQWLSTIETYANPTIGKMPVGEVTSGDVLRVLSPIWTKKPTTARRVKQRLGVVFDWAVVVGLCETSPIHGVDRALPRVRKEVRHYTALPYAQVAGFLERVREAHSHAALALEFLTLVASRTAEIIGATWDEIDIEARVWTIPGERMKAGKPHRIPLSDRCLEILDEIGPGEGDEFVFKGRQAGKPLSRMALAKFVERHGGATTVHGLRSSFRVWAAERTNVPREVAELCLAHSVGGAVEKAYMRSDLFERRRRLMEAWATYCTAQAGKVVALPLCLQKGARSRA